MPRSFSSGGIVAVNDEASPVIMLMFIKLNHSSFARPIRMVGDGAPYLWNEGSGDNFTWEPCRFALSLPADTEEAPIGTISIQNVDRRIGEAIDAINSPLSLSMWMIKSTEFFTTMSPREPKGTPYVEEAYLRHSLRNFSLNPVRVTAEHFIVDPGAEQAGQRTRKTSTPGLYVR